VGFSLDTSKIGANLSSTLQIQETAATGRILLDQKETVIEAMRANAELAAASALHIPKGSDADYELSVLRGLLHKAQMACAEKDMLILEWMHSNEALRKLCRDYGGRLGVTDEQRQKDFDASILTLAAEDARFANTNLAQKKKEQQGGTEP
jgi:hypothetical protein